ncbi:hypothetical protein KI614_02240 [Dechloromonas denitrificans]|uniref:PIN-like domain-containing protein n=1 Tax=Dechloromonas denitrificans TaxID=281362 RepID=UPI001CF8A23B|nr:PIN-like domain-containing protein [Dechloromonas denitrificans]UCV12083.1 hypothetical protein KI614_02240 [Dechloromonas denitrificans]
MLFGLNVINKTKDEHLRDIATMARDPKTLIFIDTNILAYMYKLHAGARQEFFAWADAVLSQSRLCVPAWSAGEYLSRVRNRMLHSYTPKSRDPDQPKKALEVMLETAALFVDDTVLRAINFDGDRSAFLTDFRAAVEGLPKFTRAFKHQFDPEAVHEEIQTHLSPAILNSDLTELCARAAREGDVRIEHRLPPAFRDDDKEENRFGDLIIWFEILQHSAARSDDFSQVLFVTNDEKSDWVYSPQRRMDVTRRGARKAVANSQPEVKLADPRLVSEFKRATGLANVVICSLAALIEGLSKDNAHEYAQIAAAIQINSSDISALSNGAAAMDSASGSNATEEVNDQTSPETGGVVADEVVVDTDVTVGPSEPEAVAVATPGIVAPRLQYDVDALRDSAYELDVPLEINEIIRAIKSCNWYIQNPAIAKIRSIREESFSASAWFVLGRNIYQAACGNAQKAMDFMANLDIQLSRFHDETAKHVLAGMLFEIYFNSNGEFRQKPKAHFIEKPLSVVAQEAYVEVKDFIRFHLMAHQNRLMFLPGDVGRIALQYFSESIPEASDEEKIRVLQSLQIEGRELLVEVEAETPSVWGGYLPQKFTPDDVVQDISRTLAIPRWAIASEYSPGVRPDVIFVIPEQKRLSFDSVAWGIAA